MIGIRMEKTKNLRDLGGTYCADGTIRRSLFFRGASLHKLTQADKEKLREKCGIHTVIDLRTVQEVSEKPDVKLEGVKLYHIPILHEAMMGISHERTTDMPRGLDRIPKMETLYRNIISSEYSSEQIGKVLRLIIKSAEDGGVLWHCTVGKDRCGIISALVLYILGADMETIYADYLLTNTFSQRKSDLCYFIARIISDKETSSRVRGIYTADRSFLEAAFDEMEKISGSVLGYLREKCGITESHIARIKELAMT